MPSGLGALLRPRSEMAKKISHSSGMEHRKSFSSLVMRVSTNLESVIPPIKTKLFTTQILSIKSV
jgi:hypothetical protein